jgi:hypothetical protein
MWYYINDRQICNPTPKPRENPVSKHYKAFIGDFDNSKRSPATILKKIYAKFFIAASKPLRLREGLCIINI